MSWLHVSASHITLHWIPSRRYKCQCFDMYYRHVFHFHVFSNSFLSRWNLFEIGSCFKLCAWARARAIALHHCNWDFSIELWLLCICARARSIQTNRIHSVWHGHICTYNKKIIISGVLLIQNHIISLFKSSFATQYISFCMLVLFSSWFLCYKTNICSRFSCL